MDLGQNHFFTPYGTTNAKVNLNTANAVVLHALMKGLGGQESCVEDYIIPTREQTQLTDVQEAKAQCLPGSQYKLEDFAGVSSTYFRIEVLGQKR